MDALLQAEHAAALLADEGSPPLSLYKLRYEQGEGTAGKDKADGAKQSRDTANATPALFTFPAPSLSLAFDDAQLGAVREAWELVAGPGERGEQVAAGQPEEGEAREAGEEVEYMVFQDREGVGEEDDDIVE